MKVINLVLLLLVLAGSVPASDIRSGEDVVSAMYKKYEGKWYRTLTFVQKTITHKPDGTTDVATWYEAMSVPGKLRIDIAPSENGNGMLFADGKLFSFRDGKTQGGRAFTHPLMVLGFDVYHQSVATTIAQIKAMGIDLTSLREDKWQGRSAYVIGSAAGETNKPQVWIDKKNLYFVRLIEVGGRERKNVNETQFNKYFKVKGGGWVAPEVLFYTDGRLTTTEEYTDVRVGMPLDAALWDPEKWVQADRNYWKAK